MGVTRMARCWMTLAVAAGLFAASAALADEPAAGGEAAKPVVAGGAPAAEFTKFGGPAALSNGSRLISCASDIGVAAAKRRVRVCSDVSPATHPPCNAANSCALIEDEIARGCALHDGKDDPMAGCAPAPKSKEAAAAVVRRYYSALNAHDYETAWQQWGDNGPPNQARDTFAAGFARTRLTRVTIGTLAPSEGGAGSIYQTVPVTVDATLANGTRQRFTGEYVVRRVNGVDGATAEQLRWHISSAYLSQAR